MKRKMEVSELIFKIIAYVLLIIFAAMCVYPLIYAVSSMISSTEALDAGKVILWPVGFRGDAVLYVLKSSKFWIMYSNTLFVTFVGTIWCMVYSVLGAYALSKKRLMGRHGWNFFLVFTMWFSAGVVPSYINYQQTANVFASFVGGSTSAVDMKWLIVIAMGMNATNVILLRNSFEGVPSEIEEAARIDGATELQVLFNVYIPMSKATIATVALFFGISRWNGYFWAYKVTSWAGQSYSWPVQVYIRDFLQDNTLLVNKELSEGATLTASEGLAITYAMVVFAMIPILVIYPFIQKYFAKGVNMGGVKE
ncbi:MAG: carbohydrate ABC transporter permease [Clostridiales bacterium]|nr:carbohydrate ABC transporter permease [Clostridiales bacterium]